MNPADCKKKLFACRQDFPMLQKQMHGKPLIYFDTAATAQKPQQVIDSLTDFYSNHYATVHRTVYELSNYATTAYHNARLKIQAFLNAKKSEEIIFTRGTTESINLVAYSFGKAFVKPGDEILISEIEHHSNIVPWQMLCEERGAILKTIPVNERGELLLDVFAQLLNKKTKLVAIAHISNILGTQHPIQQICQMAHAVGAKVLVDGAQAAPHLPIDVQALDADFYVFSGHKLYGPTGIGVLYGRAELLEAMPPYQGGGDMIETVSFAKTTYGKLPLKFEAGTPIIAEAIALGTAVDYLNSFGLEAIHQHEQDLLTYATEQLQEVPNLKIIGRAQEKGAIISFVIDKIHPLDIGTLLDLKGIALRTGHHCAQPTIKRFGLIATARISFGMYNNKEEIDRFMKSLQEVISLLKS